MQINLEDLRRYYASLSDEMLLDLDPDALTDAARTCYESEFAERRLTADGEPLPVTADGEEQAYELDPDWLEQASCPCAFTAIPGSNCAHDAEHAREVLLAAGIPCQLSVTPPDPSKEDPSHYDEYRVLVPAALNLKAISVLDKEIFNADIEADWRTHFAELSDDELRTLHPAAICAGLQDRIDRLTRAYNDEIARRRPE